MKSDHSLRKTKKESVKTLEYFLLDLRHFPFIVGSKKKDYINCAGELIKLALVSDGSLITHDLVKVQGYNYITRTNLLLQL